MNSEDTERIKQQKLLFNPDSNTSETNRSS